FLLGQLAEAEGNTVAAYEEYQRARTELESLRNSLSRDELKISFMKNKVDIYERLTALCLSAEISDSSRREAFGYIELAKSRSLVELISQGSTTLTVEGPGQSSLVQRIRQLREELHWYQHRVELELLRPEKDHANKIEQLRLEVEQRENALLKALADLSDTS